MTRALLAGYGATATLAAPVLRASLRRRALRGKEVAARLAEREGIEAEPRPAGRLLWLHAASMGETASMLPVLRALAGAVPDLHLLMTTGTVTSQDLLARRLPELGLAGRVRHRFAPLDVPAWVARFLDHWRPDAAAFVESEIWPNLLRACRARGVPTALVNARLSPRSFARWRRAPHLARALFGGFTAVQPQSAADAGRLRALGAEAVGAPGNLKLAADALPVDAAELARLRAVIGARPAWVAASTHPGEEDIVRAVHDLLSPAHPGLLTIIVPRHAPRGAEIARGAPRRALGQDPGAGLWIADTMGELGLFYRLAELAFVGGSLVPHGGQNPLEPARLGRAIAVGPHVFNFAEPVAALEAAGALVPVADAAGLAAWVDALLRDPAARRRAGEAGQAACAGAEALPGRVAALLAGLLPD